MADKANLFESVKTDIDGFRIKVQRIDQGVEKYDGLMTETDRSKQMAFLEKELKTSNSMLDQINYDLK